MIKINLLKAKNALPQASTSNLLKFLEKTPFSFLNNYLQKIKDQVKGASLENDYTKQIFFVLINSLILGWIEYSIEEKNLKEQDFLYADILLEKTYLQKTELKVKGLAPIKKALEEDESKLTNKINALNHLIEKGSNIIQIMLLISKNIPTQVWLESLAVESQQISLKGHSASFEAIAQFMKKFKEIEIFQMIKLERINRANNKDQIDFDLNIQRKQ